MKGAANRPETTAVDHMRSRLLWKRDSSEQQAHSGARRRAPERREECQRRRHLSIAFHRNLDDGRPAKHEAAMGAGGCRMQLCTLRTPHPPRPQATLIMKADDGIRMAKQQPAQRRGMRMTRVESNAAARRVGWDRQRATRRNGRRGEHTGSLAKERGDNKPKATRPDTSLRPPLLHPLKRRTLPLVGVTLAPFIPHQQA